MAVPPEGPTAPTLDLADIQGNVLRGYSARLARHFALGVTDRARAGRLLAALLPGAPGDGPKVSTAEIWSTKPPYCLTVGLTWAGLGSLGVPPAVQQLFPASFMQGPATPATKATQLGDDGPSEPGLWELGGPTTPTVHLLLSLYTHSHVPTLLESMSATLRSMFATGGVVEISSHDAAALPDGQVHFGYKDGIAQPRIKGVPGKQLPDMQPEVDPGDFVLGGGHINQYGGNFLGDLPTALGNNATYGAFRLLEQDAEAFENLISKVGVRYRMDAEMVAAKLMGRWRNGVPLVLSPDTPEPKGGIPHGSINEFDYAPTPEHPTYFDDQKGARCPVGSHIRRLNPRSSLVMGIQYLRRIIRRAMPYGPAYHPAKPDGLKRGLVGYFICGDLAMQFEFMQGIWANEDIATAGLLGTRDPILGAQPPEKGKFVIRTNDSRDPIEFGVVPRLVTTRGSVYCLLPGIGGLRFLAALAPRSTP